MVVFSLAAHIPKFFELRVTEIEKTVRDSFDAEGINETEIKVYITREIKLVILERAICFTF